MFTGIIETIATVVSNNNIDGDLRLVISAPDYRDREISLGDSIACNGVCLTVVARKADKLSFDVSNESINHSLIGEWTVGSRVNLEMALLPTTRMGGHLVSGHVDGLAILQTQSEDARSTRLDFSVTDELKKYIAKKGSVTINGISLTVNAVEDCIFSVNIIPHTFVITTLGDISVGERVHIEVDLIARYLERLLSGESSKESPLSKSFLAEHGFS